MINLGTILNTAGDMVDTAGRKTSELVDKTKIKMEIASLEKQLSATFEGIGRLMYDANEAGEDISYIRDDAFETVKELQKKIDKAYAKLYAYQGAVSCKQCGAVNEADAVFCKKCGKTV